MLNALLPVYQIDYQSELTPEQIGQCLTKNVITGFSLFSRIPYYGNYTAAGFSVRKTSSQFKKESLRPKVTGSYRMSNGHVLVRLTLEPHPFLLGGYLVLMTLLGLLLVAIVPDVLQTGELDLLRNALVPAAILYGAFRLLFEVQSRADIRFWEYTLQLRPCHV